MEANMAQVRVSVANLAVFLQRRGANMVEIFGIPNSKKLVEGTMIYQALGGAAELTDEGKEFFGRKFCAEKFEKDKRTGRFDARFLVGEENLEEVFSMFASMAEKAGQYEWSPIGDILDELSGKEFPGMGAIVSPDEMAGTEIVYVKTVRQAIADDGVGTSDRAASVAVPTRRMFRLYKIVVDDKLYEKLRASPILRFFTEEELASTEGGKKKGVTSDGYALADNLFQF